MRKQPGRENAHVPTSKELKTNLYQNRDKGGLRGTFNTSGAGREPVYYYARPVRYFDNGASGSFTSCYRSSTPYRFPFNVRTRYFDDGSGCIDNFSSYRLPVRLVWYPPTANLRDLSILRARFRSRVSLFTNPSQMLERKPRTDVFPLFPALRT